MSAVSRRPEPHSYFVADAAADIVRRVREAGGGAPEVHALLEEIVFTVLCEIDADEDVLDNLADRLAERVRLLRRWMEGTT